MIYKSRRVGKNGKIFNLYKIRTLKQDADKSNLFVREDQYLPFGKFLRKYKLDELPQLINVLKGDMRIFGYRPEEERTFKLYPKEIQEILKREKPGIIDLSSLHFFNEEEILQLGEDYHKDYWEKIRPIKLSLQMFYIQNRCFLLNLAILWIYCKKILWSMLKRRWKPEKQF